MKKALAENLLARIMGWDDEAKARERARLEVLAAYKYDQYQQFAPGRRFLESLALWLRQFSTLKERATAYDFIRRRLIFISDDELNQLVELAFPAIVRPILFSDAAADAQISPTNRVKVIANSIAYRCRLRQTLILGLSDGARTDRFRRVNSHAISHEQVFHAYDVSHKKAGGMREKLKHDLTNILGQEPRSEEAVFKYVVLLDDFTASGTSYIREGESADQWEGKIPKIISELEKSDGLGSSIATQGVRVLVVLYIASEQAIRHIGEAVKKLKFAKGTIELQVVFRLSEAARLDQDSEHELFELLGNPNYFDPKADDEHGAVGGTTMQFGYADGRLPIVLSHNTPNNSVYLLWAEDVHNVLGLFPRVSRHRHFQ